MKPTLPPADQQILKALQQAVSADHERKQRLGHYYVAWQDGQVVLQEPDVPKIATDDRSR